MNRIDRLHAILTHLQSKKRVTAQQLADRFDLSLRTVYRDIKALEESGVPVTGEAGVGYSVMEGYRLPPVMFTQEEAMALLLSAKLAEQLTDDSVRKQMEAAIFKVKAVLRANDKDFVDTLTPLIDIRQRPLPDGISQQYITTILTAIGQKRVLQMVYRANYRDELTDRAIEPIGVSYYGQAWHLIAWCRLRNDYRDFRISRVQKMSVADESFENAEHPSMEQYIQQMMSRDAELKEAVVCFKKDVARFVGEYRYYNGFVSEEVREDGVYMKFLTGCLEHFSRWLLTYTDGVRVESPAALQETMCSLTLRLSSHYC
ncbi:MAG: YafY family protein [Chitinophagaceae bacterium]